MSESIWMWIRRQQMSWSLSRQGEPREVKREIAVQAESAKACCASLPAEVKSIEQAAQLINIALDFHIEQKTPNVQVSAWGSGCLRGDGWDANLEVSVSVKKFDLPKPVVEP